MTTSCRTVSTEEVKRFAEQMAEQVGLTHLLHMEVWASPSSQALPVPERFCAPRHAQLHARMLGRSAKADL
jgi:hypothetical protein